MPISAKAGTVIMYVFGIISMTTYFWKWGISGKTCTACVFLFFLILAVWEDIHVKRIPDKVVIGAGIAGIVSVPFFSEISLGSRGIGTLCVSLLLLIIVLIVPGSFGGGDIKLMAASGIFLGWKCNLRAFVLAVFIAGAYCSWMLLRKKINCKEQIAFGPFLCAGIMLEVIFFL